METNKKFKNGQVLEVYYLGKIQKAEVLEVSNFYVRVEINFKGYRLSKDELLECVRQAKQKRNEEEKSAKSEEKDESTKGKG